MKDEGSAFGPAHVILLVLVGLVAALARPASAQIPLQQAVPPVKNPKLPAIVPFRFWNGVPVVDCFVNGTTFTSFGVDTGLNAVTVRPQAYSQLSLPALPTRARLNVMQTTTDATQANIKDLRVASVDVPDVKAAVIDVATLLSSVSRPDGPGGWLGTPFLSAFQVTLDFATRSLVLSDAGAPLLEPKGSVTVPIELRDGRPWVKVEAAPAHPFSALVDTGTRGTLVPADVAQKLKLKPTLVAKVRGGVNAQSRIGYAVAPALAVGKAEQTDVPVAFLPADAPTPFDRTFSILGTDFLKHYRVTISYAKKKMVLAPLIPVEDNETAKADDAGASP